MARKTKGLGSAPADHLKQARWYAQSARGFAAGASAKSRDCKHHVTMVELAREQMGHAKAHLESARESAASVPGFAKTQTKVQEADERVKTVAHNIRGKCVRE